jgi:CBS domain containing-hemolysin-like protein
VIIDLLIILFLVALTALYVGAEFASVAVRVVRIQALAEEGNATAKKLLPHLKDAHSLDRYVAACQVGITVSSLVLGAYGQKRLAIHFQPFVDRLGGLDAVTTASITATAVLILMTVFHVVLGELLPKAIALRFPEKIALALTYPMLLSLLVFGWSIKLLNGTGNWILGLFKIPTAGHRHVHSPEELQQLVSHDVNSVDLEAGERQLLTRVFRFGNHVAQNVMVPRMKMVLLNLEAPLEESLKVMEASGHTRFPVVIGDADKVEGYVHLKDVTVRLAEGDLTELRTLLRPAAFAPSNLPVDRLFERMRKERVHLMVLLDEFGGTAGILTMEDVLQEVVGEMRDEFSPKKRHVLEKTERSLLVRGNMLLDALAEETDHPFESSPANTVGGLVMHLLERPAVEGDTVEFSGLRFTVTQVQGKRVARVRVDHD